MTKHQWLKIKRVDLTNGHLRPGRTKHFLAGPDGKTEFPPFTSLVIAQYPGDPGFYLLHLCDDGSGTDTHHASLQEAIDQAAYEFEVMPEEWIDLNFSTPPDKA